MKDQTAYTHLAEWFEYLNDDCDYENWSQYLITELEKYPLKSGLDIGCGSGYFTRFFHKRGYDAVGMDLSTSMLDKAKEIARKEGIPCRFIQGDVTRFITPQKYDFATAINDCINYVKKEKLTSAFRCVKNALKKGGIFLFDISSKRKFEKKVADTISIDDREDITYFSFNQKRGDEVLLDVSLFVKQEDGRYVRKEEKHLQYVYTVEEITSALNEVGFTLLKAEGINGEEIESADRICFLAQK